MDGGQSTYEPGTPLADLADRIRNAGATVADRDRLGHAVLASADGLHTLITALRISRDELRAVLDFLTDVGHAADARRQEWVLLADVMGVSTLVDTLNCQRPVAATPNSLPAPFYRADAPEIAPGGTLSRDGRGVPLAVNGRVVACSGQAVSGAMVEVWHANAEGFYENQQPEVQPEFNLRGRLRTDALGRFQFNSIMPKGYALPEDGPVGRLMNSLGLRLERPAHVHFRISAPGHDPLITQIFDRDDPAIGRDALFGVKPETLGDFGPSAQPGLPVRRTLTVAFTLAEMAHPSPPAHPTP